jgi:hypothetical protein
MELASRNYPSMATSKIFTTVQGKMNIGTWDAYGYSLFQPRCIVEREVVDIEAVGLPKV